jgi:phage/plasmid-like protein (TIGR03299 family)
MSHLILEHDGMASVRTVPWHKHLTGDRTRVLEQEPTSIVEWLEVSGLGWRTLREPAYRRVLLADPDGGDPIETFVPAKDVEDVEWTFTIRSDIGGILGCVTDDYKEVHNIEGFQFLDALLGGDVEFQTAGSIQNGKRVWVLAKIPGAVDLAGSPAFTFMFCTNAHDGSGAVMVAATNVEIVCANTLNWAISGARRTWKFRHTGNLTQRFAEARQALNMTVGWSESAKAVADRLGVVQLSEKEEKKIVSGLSVCKVEDGMGTRAKQNREEIRDLILRINRGEGPAGDTRANTAGSAWCLVRSIGEFADWHRRYTVNTDQVRRSFEDGGLKQEGLDRVLAAV